MIPASSRINYGTRVELWPKPFSSIELWWNLWRHHISDVVVDFLRKWAVRVVRVVRGKGEGRGADLSHPFLNTKTVRMYDLSVDSSPAHAFFHGISNKKMHALGMTRAMPLGRLPRTLFKNRRIFNRL